MGKTLTADEQQFLLFWNERLDALEADALEAKEDAAWLVKIIIRCTAAVLSFPTCIAGVRREMKMPARTWNVPLWRLNAPMPAPTVC